MPDDKIVAARYARAAYAVAVKQNAGGVLADDMHQVESLLRAHPALFKLLINPVLPVEEKSAVVQKVFGPAAGSVCINTLKLMLQKNRMKNFFAVSRCIADIHSELQNRLDVKAVSAFPLPQSTQEMIVTFLKKLFGKEIGLQCELQPALLGGIQLHVGDRVIDGSVQYQLRQMASRLVSL